MIKNTYELCLGVGGKLSVLEQQYSYASGKHTEVEKAAEGIVGLLDKTIVFKKGVSLNDLFVLVSNYVDDLGVIGDCSLSSFIEYWRSLKITKKTKHSYDPNGIEFLNLYWTPSIRNGYFCDTERPDFDGEGWKLKEDLCDYDPTVVSHKKGSRISWGLDMTPLQDIIHLKLILNEDFKLIKRYRDGKTGVMKKKSILSCKKSFTLKNVIEGVFWELSFYGSPAMAAKSREELTSRIDDIGNEDKFTRVGSEKWKLFKDEMMKK